MLTNNIWIIGGQHTIKTIREVMNGLSFVNHDDIKIYCSYYRIVVVWSLDNINNVRMLTMFSFKILHKAKKNWVEQKKTKTCEIKWYALCKMEYDLFDLKYIDHSFYTDVCIMGGFVMQMLRHFCACI
jgi:peroxiredoxin family protein